MAHKSKTQRAKASAARAARKAERAQQAAEGAAGASTTAEATKNAEVPTKKGLFGSKAAVEQKSEAPAPAKKTEKPVAKRSRLAFFKDVRAELKRVTWPSRQDVIQWSVVVVAALLFFGIYVGLLDNIVITPLLVAISGLGA
ncbi:preprotein translocase subunit SecE [Eggerthellaceae bacterium zg-1084]|uniref:preprotein translocase subunit SecE n=1 Tax=Berryella wangjianweii TaxID=2734634 RepID=UPI00155520B2|nr:preprotein translocase subunit SecE [Berryella wangjianweii]NPD31471.1 preprotein translocase subunit SecE [Berryella wangjianweii]NPD33030.1 preprotein translocase subunit SecE [Eggerthellaceae bacterium zg-997]